MHPSATWLLVVWPRLEVLMQLLVARRGGNSVQEKPQIDAGFLVLFIF